MSLSRISSNSRPKPAPRPSSATLEPKMVQLKSRIDQIANKMRITRDPSTSDTQSTKPLKRTESREPSYLESFLVSNNLEQYLKTFNDNQLTFDDLAFLSKQDYSDMGIPIGPRNRIMKLAQDYGGKECKENRIDSQERSSSRFSRNKNEIRDDVDKFFGELAQVSQRSVKNRKNYSKDFALEDEIDGKMFESILTVLKDIGEKQKIMEKAIKENQKAVEYLRQQSHSEHIKTNYYK